jgi:hypothetical protein
MQRELCEMTDPLYDSGMPSEENWAKHCMEVSLLGETDCSEDIEAAEVLIERIAEVTNQLHVEWRTDDWLRLDQIVCDFGDKVQHMHLTVAGLDEAAFHRASSVLNRFVHMADDFLIGLTRENANVREESLHRMKAVVETCKGRIERLEVKCGEIERVRDAMTTILQ